MSSTPRPPQSRLAAGADDDQTDKQSFFFELLQRWNVGIDLVIFFVVVGVISVLLLIAFREIPIPVLKKMPYSLIWFISIVGALFVIKPLSPNLQQWTTNHFAEIIIPLAIGIGLLLFWATTTKPRQFNFASALFLVYLAVEYNPSDEAKLFFSAGFFTQVKDRFLFPFAVLRIILTQKIPLGYAAMVLTYFSLFQLEFLVVIFYLLRIFYVLDNLKKKTDAASRDIRENWLKQTSDMQHHVYCRRNPGRCPEFESRPEAYTSGNPYDRDGRGYACQKDYVEPGATTSDGVAIARTAQDCPHSAKYCQQAIDDVDDGVARKFCSTVQEPRAALHARYETEQPNFQRKSRELFKTVTYLAPEFYITIVFVLILYKISWSTHRNNQEIPSIQYISDISTNKILVEHLRKLFPNVDLSADVPAPARGRSTTNVSI
jgi:hypothetical protein